MNSLSGAEEDLDKDPYSDQNPDVGKEDSARSDLRERLPDPVILNWVEVEVDDWAHSVSENLLV